MAELQRLYTLTVWRPAIFVKRGASGRFSPVSLMKALALPYLVRIPTDAALAKELAERDALRTLCGFIGPAPSRSILWHFRQTVQPDFGEIALAILSSMASGARELGFELPFATPIGISAAGPFEPKFETQVSKRGLRVSASPLRSFPEPPSGAEEMGSGECECRPSSPGPGDDANPGAQLQLPCVVRVAHGHVGSNNDEEFFVFRAPAWLQGRENLGLRGIDAFDSEMPSASASYNACNVIIPRVVEDGRVQVLLARRLGPGAGRGQFTVPGGKQRPDESLADCVGREVWEETGLRVVQSRPVSIRRGRRVGQGDRTCIWSIGAVAVEYSGEPTRREDQQLSEWEWFYIIDLPSPMFEPASWVISDFKEGRYQDLRWSDLEPEVAPWRGAVARQARLPGFEIPAAGNGRAPAIQP